MYNSYIIVYPSELSLVFLQKHDNLTYKIINLKEDRHCIMGTMPI